MPNENQAKPKEVGIPGLPKNWAVAVQLVGTFGLAVFLVLYYVLVMRPEENDRYDKLSDAVILLETTVAGQQSQLTRAQTSQLDDLFVMAMANEVADVIVAELKDNPTAESLAKEIGDELIFHTGLLEGLRQKGGGAISEMLIHKIRNSRISQRIAKTAVDKWSTADSEMIASECREELNYAIKSAAKE
ncbi:MAG: hypothetical protein ACYS8Z_08555 [Planctomycetota bacterium]|jgi:hypothetical protein